MGRGLMGMTCMECQCGFNKKAVILTLMMGNVEGWSTKLSSCQNVAWLLNELLAMLLFKVCVITKRG